MEASPRETDLVAVRAWSDFDLETVFAPDTISHAQQVTVDPTRR